MRMSHFFGATLREAPSEAEIISHQLLVRAGFISQLGAGIFSYLHLAKRMLSKIENILREEMNAIGGQEISMPVVHPADVWKESGRWYTIGSEMGRFKDKNQHDMALAMTHEEIITDLARKHVRSYKQLPLLVYHIQTKWRDDPRPRAGLIRVREFTMKDSYTLDRDEEGLDRQYRAHYQAYFKIFQRCALPVIAVKADVGMMGGKLAHEFMYLSPIGEDTLVICPHCGYTANRQVAIFSKEKPASCTPQKIEKVATPGVTSIEDLAKYLNLPASQTAKAVFMVAKVIQAEQEVEQFIFAVVRGDMEVNETKISNLVHAKDLRPAREEEIRAVGATPGYASPMGVHHAAVIVDDLVANSPNLVAGANEEGFHLLNTNFGRDYQADIIADIVVVEEGYPCPQCQHPLQTSRGIETANIFKLGTRYSESLGAGYLDQNGKTQPIVMGSYGIGVGRLLACVAEEHHDENGLIWPMSIAPYQVHLVCLNGAEETSEQIYNSLCDAGIEVFYDDREESAGVKFNDADLIGIPIRITVSKRSVKENCVELKYRHQAEKSLLPIPQIIPDLKQAIQFQLDQLKEPKNPAPYIE